MANSGCGGTLYGAIAPKRAGTSLHAEFVFSLANTVGVIGHDAPFIQLNGNHR